MIRRLACAVSVAAFSFAAVAVADDEVDDAAHLTKSSEAFEAGADAAMVELSKGFADNLETRGLGALSDGEVKAAVATIKKEIPIEGISVGKAGDSYDIILQPGHYGRKKGFTGATGARVAERALTAHLVKGIAQELSDSGLRVLIVPADGVTRGLKTKIFLSIHADGAAKKCATGPSLAYESDRSLLAMHAIGLSLATAFGYKYKDFRKDGYTTNSAEYYMFKKIEASHLEGLLEVGEITCPKSEDRLLATSKELAYNIAHALKFIAGLKES